MSLTLTISKLRFPNNASIDTPITVTLYYKEYYDDEFTLLGTGINVDVDGNIMDSPLPTITVDPELKYVLKVINELCGYEYEQSIIINAYCPVNYELSEDGTYCFLLSETNAIPPTNQEIAEAKTSTGTNSFGTLIFDPGYSVSGTGSFTQISYANSFWVNGPGYPTLTGTLVDGPMNRAAIWSATTFEGQSLGYSVCLDITEDKTIYIGMSADDKATIKIDGQIVIEQDPLILEAYLEANGYPSIPANQACIKFFFIYPVEVKAGTRLVEMIGYNILGTTPGNASMCCEIYDLTSAEIQAATSYVDMGDGLLFSSKDKVGEPIEVGTNGVGYTCPDGFSLVTCSSPYVCRKVLTTPVLY